MKRWILTCFTMLLLVASPAGAKPAGNEGPGNSGAAKQCKKGGWETRARAEDFDTAFVSEEECVSYGAQDGTIVPYVAPTPTVILSWSPLDFGCQVFVTVTGFADGTYGLTGLETYSLITSIDVSGGQAAPRLPG